VTQSSSHFEPDSPRGFTLVAWVWLRSSLLTPFLLARTSLPSTFLILGIGSAAIILVLAQFLRAPAPRSEKG